MERKQWIFSQKKVEVEFHEGADDLDEFKRKLIDEMRRYEMLENSGRRASSFRRHALEQIQDRLIEGGYLVDHWSRSIPLFIAAVVIDIVAVILSIFLGSSFWVVAGLLFRWAKKLADSLKEAREELAVPPWAEDVTDESIEAASQTYVAFQFYYHVTTAAAAAVAPSSGTAGASGAGAGGGAGGGGGGAG